MTTFLHAEIGSVPVVAVLLGLAVVVALVAGLRRRGGRWLRRALAGVAVFAALAGVADGVNAWFGYWPRVADVLQLPDWPVVQPEAVTGEEPAPPGVRHTGGVVTFPVPGTVSGFGTRVAYAYLPPQYFTEPSRRFPVVYLLHGSPGRPVDWLRGGRAVSAALAVARSGHPLIVVIPRVSRGWLDDSECVDGRSERVDTYLSRDVVIAVDGWLRTVPDRGARAVAGMSAGGFCALNEGLRHRSEFSAVLDMSGLTRPTHSGGVTALFGPGAAGQARFLANDPEHYAATLRPDPPTMVRMDVGRSDGKVRREMQALVPQLRGHGITTSFVLRPGFHTFRVWVPALRSGLAWLAPYLDGTASGGSAV